MKKLMLLVMACMLVISFSSANTADAAKRGGSYKAPSKSYSPTSPSKDSGVTKTDPAKSTTTPGAATTANRGFFSGGGLMKGLMIGGIAGMLFGGMFGGLGAFGDILGMLINVLAIVVLFVVIRKIYVYFRDRNQTEKKRFQE